MTESEAMVSLYCTQLLSAVTLIVYIENIISLELLELRVPAHVALGTRAALACRWALGPADVLYSVKWYKDGKEFFRHLPRDHQPQRKFPLPGVDIEQADASGSSLVLTGAVLETGGRYRCEVSGERPLFPTVSKHADMNVVVLPENGPTISGIRHRYHLGDNVRLNCTSGRSLPSNQLFWYINGEPAPAKAVLPAIHQTYDDQLETTTLLLDFVLSEQYFKKNVIKVKCLATLESLYWRSNEKIALLEKGRIVTAHAHFTPVTKTAADRVHSNLAILLTGSTSSIVILLLAVIFIRR